MKEGVVKVFPGKTQVEYELSSEEWELILRFEKRGEFLDAMVKSEYAGRKLLRELRARAERLDGLNSRHQQQTLEL